MAKRLTLPHEHGAVLTAVGAAVASAAVAPAPLPAVGVGLAVTATFFARGAIERLAIRAPLRDWDGYALAALGLVALGGATLAGGRAPGFAAATLALCAAMGLASALARRTRVHRTAAVEWLGLAGLGANAALGALAAGAAPGLSAAIGLLIATHVAVAVPIVRSELRRREHHLGGRALLLATAGVLVAAATVAWIGPPALALALAPRAAQVLHRAVSSPPQAPPRPATVGLRETALLAACVAIVVAAGS